MRRLAALAGILAVGVGGLVVLNGDDDATLGLAERYVGAWSRSDFATMHALLTEEARERTPADAFARAHRSALRTATAVRLAPVGAATRTDDGPVRVAVEVRTRAFGRLSFDVELAFEGENETARVAWEPHLAFPGVDPGETLERTTELPPRAALLARDGSVLAEGETRTPEAALADVAPDVVGRVGAVPEGRAEGLRGLGVPRDAPVGLSGLELILEDRLRGTPGGRLTAGTRTLAQSTPKAAPSVRTTISAGVVRAAVAGLAGRLGGVVALDPRSGAVLGYAGIAFSGLQPPGSTMKILTLVGALETGIATPRSQYPVETKTVLEGVELENANGESCGGSLARSFALSCNSVFAPLGAELGAQGLVDVAERFGFNGKPLLPGAAVATIPPAEEIGDALAVGSSAIGQGRVQATALQMASVAATIGLRGRRPALTLDLDTAKARERRGDGGRGTRVRVTSPGVARTVEKLMLGVVREGTGANAAIAGVRVAGKTGTAELQSTQRCEVTPTVPPATAVVAPIDPESCSAADDPTDTDAWFAAYAPAGDAVPRVAVGVLVVRAGAGGDTAAPVARQVMLAALKR